MNVQRKKLIKENNVIFEYFDKIVEDKREISEQALLQEYINLNEERNKLISENRDDYKVIANSEEIIKMKETMIETRKCNLDEIDNKMTELEFVLPEDKHIQFEDDEEDE